MRQISSSLGLLLASGAAAAAQTQIAGSTVDTSGFEDIAILVTLGAITATGTVTLKAQAGEAADGSDKADIAGASVTVGDANSNKFMLLEIHRPKQRYITPIINRGTANSAIQTVHVILGNPSLVPVTQTLVAGSVALNSPNLA